MTLAERLIAAADWFIPSDLQGTTATLWRARIFVISHILGPFSAVAVLGYLYRVLPSPDWVFWTLCVVCGSFWVLPMALRIGRTLVAPALYSFCALLFVGLFGSFFFGGVSSPFMPWFLTAQLLGFFYLSNRPMLVLRIIGASLVTFAAAYWISGSFPTRIPIEELSTVGMISVCAATLYSSMMAIYYAYVMVAQSALQQEVKNHLATAERLWKAKQEAERANDAKAVFLAKMSHQLRTPLNAIIGYSEILIEDSEADGGGTDTEELRSINRAGRHLLSLVSDVLHMPKIDAEDVDMHLGEVDLDVCLEEVFATCRHLIANNGNSFTIEKSAALGSIQTDDKWLRQILINLLGNAGKFTRNGRVVLRAQRQGDSDHGLVLISVRDSGIGIAPDVIPTLFKNFSRVESNEHDGTGLGLAVSQKLANLLSGEISVQSWPKQGSEFTLRLPVAAKPQLACA